jgi:hypothetical protein
MYAQGNSVSGSSLFNAFMGGAAGNETIRMHEYSFGLAYGMRF